MIFCNLSQLPQVLHFIIVKHVDFHAVQRKSTSMNFYRNANGYVQETNSRENYLSLKTNILKLHTYWKVQQSFCLKRRVVYASKDTNTEQNQVLVAQIFLIMQF